MLGLGHRVLPRDFLPKYLIARFLYRIFASLPAVAGYGRAPVGFGRLVRFRMSSVSTSLPPLSTNFSRNPAAFCSSRAAIASRTSSTWWPLEQGMRGTGHTDLGDD